MDDKICVGDIQHSDLWWKGGVKSISINISVSLISSDQAHKKGVCNSLVALYRMYFTAAIVWFDFHHQGEPSLCTNILHGSVLSPVLKCYSKRTSKGSECYTL